jgi:hypothetical protein
MFDLVVVAGGNEARLAPGFIETIKTLEEYEVTLINSNLDVRNDLAKSFCVQDCDHIRSSLLRAVH